MAVKIARQTQAIEDRTTDLAVRRADENVVRLAQFTVPTGVVLDWRGLDTDAEVQTLNGPGWLRCITDETLSYSNEFLADGVTPNPYYEGALTSYTGRRVLIREYRELYAVIGNTYGGKRALGEFRLPDETPATRIIKT